MGSISAPVGISEYPQPDRSQHDEQCHHGQECDQELGLHPSTGARARK